MDSISVPEIPEIVDQRYIITILLKNLLLINIGNHPTNFIQTLMSMFLTKDSSIMKPSFITISSFSSPMKTHSQRYTCTLSDLPADVRYLRSTTIFVISDLPADVRYLRSASSDICHLSTGVSDLPADVRYQR